MVDLKGITRTSAIDFDDKTWDLFSYYLFSFILWRNQGDNWT